MSKPLRPAALLSLDEARAVLRTLAKAHGKDAAVTRVVCRLALEAGLRASEICRLRLEHCALGNGRPQLWVDRSKRGRSRAVDVGPGLARFLRRYLAEERPGLLRGDDPGTVIVSSRTGRPITRCSAWRRWKGVLRRAGLPAARVEELKLHSARHSFATRQLEKGASVARVRDLLGHADVSTTSRYLGVADLPALRGVDLYDEAAV